VMAFGRGPLEPALLRGFRHARNAAR
jgi:hypothetical protein